MEQGEQQTVRTLMSESLEKMSSNLGTKIDILNWDNNRSKFPAKDIHTYTIDKLLNIIQVLTKSYEVPVISK